MMGMICPLPDPVTNLLRVATVTVLLVDLVIH